MKSFIGLFVILCGILAFWSLRHQHALVAVPPDATTGVVNHDAVPVVVELFTSEGCSSCPPADEVLSKLDQTQPIQGVEIITLGEHVDYWNHLGWADPYSNAEFSRRQGAYSDAFKQSSVYTPQMIVDGQEEFVGANMDRARTAIAHAAQSPKASIELFLSPESKGPNPRAVKLSLHVRDLPPLAAGDTAEVLLAITENNLRSEVSRGENNGRSLKHSAVVRQLTTLAKISAGQNYDAEPTVNLAGAWKRENLRAVAFVQERGTRRIIGAAVLGLFLRSDITPTRTEVN
jgi:hypothetical protein